MINLRKIQVCIDEPIEIGSYFLNADMSPCDIDEVHYNVSIFHIYVCPSKDLFKLCVRPIVTESDNDGEHICTHPLEFLMSYDEASEVYKDPKKFIKYIYERDCEVFNQDPIAIATMEHNTCVTRSRNSKVTFINPRSTIESDISKIKLISYDPSTGKIYT